MAIHYANLSSGLRGCYADNNGYILKFKTRKELKSAVSYEASSMQNAGYVGASKRNVAAFVQEYWKRCNSPRPGYLDTCLPIKPDHSDNYSMGIFLSPSNKADYMAAIEDDM